MNHCLNCEQQYEGNYCNSCGQKSSTHRLSVMHLLHDLQHTLFHIDRGIYKNIFSIRSPRATIMSYINGKRAGFFNPVMFFMILLGLMLFAEGLVYVKNQIVFDIRIPFVSERNFNASDFFNHYIHYFFFCSCFVFALPALWIFKKETGYNYAEQVIVMVFLLSYVNIVYIPFLLFSEKDTYPIDWIMGALIYLFTVIIFYRGKLWLTMLKAFVVLLLQVLFFFIFALVVGISVALLKDLFSHQV